MRLRNSAPTVDGWCSSCCAPDGEVMPVEWTGATRRNPRMDINTARSEMLWRSPGESDFQKIPPEGSAIFVTYVHYVDFLENHSNKSRKASNKNAQKIVQTTSRKSSKKVEKLIQRSPENHRRENRTEESRKSSKKRRETHPKKSRKLSWRK